MFRKLVLAATAGLLTAMAGFAVSQSNWEVTEGWKRGLSMGHQKIVMRIADDEDARNRWMIYTAIVRAKEAASAVIPGESLTQQEVLAHVKVRMTADEHKWWNETWSELSTSERNQLVTILRSCLRNG